MTAPFLTAWGRQAWWAFAIVVLSSFLGSRGLNEPDEGRYAEIGREMVASGDWLVPTLNGIEHFQKPPMLYWETAACLRAFGINEWAARLPSALAAFGTVLLTFAIGRKLFGERVARNAAVVLTSAFGFVIVARLLTPDMLMSFWITAAIAALVHRHRWSFFIAMGLGFLTKGPMALLVPAAAAAAWQWSTRRDDDHVRLPWGRGLALTLVIGLSWFVAMSALRPELLNYFWRYELVKRIGSHAHGRSKPIWFFAPVLILALLPWSVFLWRPIRAAWRRVKHRHLPPREALLLGWTLVPLVVLSLSGSKLPTYIAPLLPAFAIAVATAVGSPLRLWSVALASATAWLAIAATADRFAPLMGRQASVRNLANEIRRQPDFDQATIFTCGVRAHGIEFYLERLVSMTRNDADMVFPPSPAISKRLFKNPAECVARLTGLSPAYGIVDAGTFEVEFPSRSWHILSRCGDFVLVVNRPPPP